jgi:signal transduction histidine kinase
MDAATVDNLFKLEKKQSTPGTNNEPGTGLGLIIVKELTEKSGGNITVQSKKSEGTTFIITIPKESFSKLD